MVRPSSVVIGAFLLWALGCSDPVVREGSGWRELGTSEPGKTRIAITSTDPAVLADLARQGPDPRIRAEAQQRVSDPAVLADLARHEPDPGLRRKLVDRLGDEGLLREIAAGDPDPSVKQAARARGEILRTVDVRHPEYAGWASCKPGTWVKLKVDLRVDGSRTSVEIIRTLLEECCRKRPLSSRRWSRPAQARKGSAGTCWAASTWPTDGK